jgi:hypothetical protein
MSTSQLDRLANTASDCGFIRSNKSLPPAWSRRRKGNFLRRLPHQLLACEIDAKTHKHHQMRIAMARFPYQKWT